MPLQMPLPEVADMTSIVIIPYIINLYFADIFCHAAISKCSKFSFICTACTQYIMDINQVDIFGQ